MIKQNKGPKTLGLKKYRNKKRDELTFIKLLFIQITDLPIVAYKNILIAQLTIVLALLRTELIALYIGDYSHLVLVPTLILHSTSQTSLELTLMLPQPNKQLGWQASSSGEQNEKQNWDL